MDGKATTRLAISLSQMGLDAAYIVNNVNIFYLTGFFTNPHERHMGALVAADGQVALVIPTLEAEHARTSTAARLFTYEDSGNPFDTARQCLEDLGVATGYLGVENGSLTVKTFSSLQQALPKVHWEDVTDLMAELRLTKTPEEIERMRRAGQIADQVMADVAGLLQPGATEIDIATEIEFRLRRTGGLAFDAIVLFGENGAQPHGQPGQRALGEGDLVVVDLGGRYEGYCSDITRTLLLGEPTPTQQAIYRVVLKAQQAAIDAIRPGRPLAEVDEAARTVITDAGYGPYFVHRVGHGLGLEAHEAPSVNGRNSEPMREGMVFSVEPGIYVPGVGGVRIEDAVAVTATGAERLNNVSRSLAPADYGVQER